MNKIIIAHNKEGAAIFKTKGKGVRKNSYMSYQEEEKFIKEFEKLSLQGQISTVLEIQKR